MSKFSVVYTIESPKDTSLSVHVVPTHWLVDGVLYYPPSKFGKSKTLHMIKASEFITVDLKWKKYAYVLKKTFTAYDTACKYAESKEKSEDTDSDADNAILKKLQKQQGAINYPAVVKKGELPQSFFTFILNISFFSYFDSVNIHERRSNDLNKMLLGNIDSSQASTSKTIHLQIDALDEQAKKQQLSTDSDDEAHDDDLMESNVSIVPEPVEMDLPVLNMEEYFSRMENRLEKKLSETIKVEFAKAAVLLTNVLNNHYGGGKGVPLLPVPAVGMPMAEAFTDNTVLEELNTPISTEAGVVKLESDLKIPDVVQR